MIVAHGQITVGEGSLRWAVVFARRFWMSVAEHRGLVVDTSVIPPTKLTPRGGTCLYLLTEGRWRTRGGPTFTAPAAIVVSQAQLEGSRGARPFTYRLDGAPLCMIELHVDTPLRAGEQPFAVELDAAAWSAARRLFEPGDEGATRDAAAALLGRLAALGLVDEQAGTTDALDATIRLMWRGIRPIVERFDLLGTVKEITAGIGATPREFDRYARRFLDSFGVVGGGWREVTHHLRLKLAVIFLSAKGATVAQLASALAYGSTDAMLRAFRDAGLAAPSAVRSQLEAAELDEDTSAR